MTARKPGARRGRPPKPAAARRAELLRPARRWSRRRKFALVAAVREGVLSLREVKAAHRLSADEFAAWAAAQRAHEQALAARERGRAA